MPGFFFALSALGLFISFFTSAICAEIHPVDWEKRWDSIKTLREDGYLKDSLSLADQTLSSARKLLDDQNPIKYRALYEYAATLYCLDQFKEAKKIVSLGLALQNSNKQENSPEMVRNLELLAKIQIAHAQASQARTNISQAVAILKTLGTGHDELEASLLHSMAVLERESGQYEEAFRLGSQALVLLSGKDQFFTMTARVAYDLGSIALEAGWISRAKELLDKCVRTLENKVAKDHPSWAYAMEAMAVVLILSGNLASPLPLIEGAIQIQSKWFSSRHSRVIESRLLKGMLLDLIGDRTSARQEFQSAVQSLSEIFGNQHPKMINPLAYLAKTYDRVKDVKLAEKNWKMAHEIALKYYDNSHPIMINLEIDQANLLMRQAKYFQAESILNSCLKLLENLNGNDSSALVRVLEPFSILYRAQGRNKDALNSYIRIFNIQLKTHGRGHPDITRTLEKLTGLLYELGQVSNALKWAHEDVEKLVKERGENHQEVLTRVGNVIFLAQVADENKIALEGYLMALRIQRRHFGSAHPEVATTLFKTSGLLRKMGQDQEAESMEREAQLINMGGNPEDKDILFKGKRID